MQVAILWTTVKCAGSYTVDHRVLVAVLCVSHRILCTVNHTVYIGYCILWTI